MTVADLFPILIQHYRINNLKSLDNGLLYHFQKVVDRMGDYCLDNLNVREFLARLEAYKASRIEGGRSPQTVNNELALLRRGLNLAFRQGLIERAPFVALYRASMPRGGFLAPQDFPKLIFALEVLDEVVAEVVRFLYGLGWRKEEVLGLTWDEVDERTSTLNLKAERTKMGKPRTVRLPEDLRQVLARRIAAKKEGCPFVFHRDGRNVKHFRKPWCRARKVCGKPTLLVHDLRRSFARNAIQAGIPQKVVMELGGWRTISIFHRYCIVDEGQLGAALERISSQNQKDAAAGGTGFEVAR